MNTFDESGPFFIKVKTVNKEALADYLLLELEGENISINKEGYIVFYYNKKVVSLRF